MKKRNQKHKKKAQYYEESALQDDPRELGDLDSENIIGAEERTLASKYIEKSGKVTLPQYLALVGAGFDGDIVRRWTENHAAREIEKRKLDVGTTDQEAEKLEIQKRERQLLEQATKDRLHQEHQRRLSLHRQDENGWPICPVCQVRVSTEQRLSKHLRKVHES